MANTEIHIKPIGAVPALIVKDEAIQIAGSASSFIFTGLGVTASAAGDVITINIPGAGSSSFVFLGAYDLAHTYNVGDAVTYNNDIWVLSTGWGTPNHAPEVSHWTLLLTGADAFTGTTSQYVKGDGTYGTFPTGLAPTGSAGGDLSGTYPNPSVDKVHGVDFQNGTPSDGDVWNYDTTNSRWKHSQLSAANVGLGNVPNIDATIAANIIENSTHRFTTDVEKAVWNAKEPAIATGTTSQYWRGDKSWQTFDKAAIALGNVPNVDATNPVNITQTAIYRFVTDIEKSTWNAKQDALGFTPETSTQLNSRDVVNRDRANHTGTQVLSTISDVTITAANLNALDDGVDTTLHFHASDRNRTNHTGTQSADTIIDGTTNKAYTATEKTKLSGIATGATANDTDANLKNRANHTGAQTASTISDFNSAALAAAPAETTTTEGALINGATSKTTPVDADSIGLVDSAASNILKKLTWANAKATLKTYFDTLYATVNTSTFIPKLTGNETFRGVNYSNNSTTEVTSGGVTMSTSASAIARSVATTNYATRIVRKGFTASVVATGRYTGTRGTALLWYVSGGFKYVCDFYISDTAYGSGCRQFYGLQGTTADLTYTDVILVASLLNCIGVGSDSADTNLQIFYNDGTGTASKIDLGSSFPANRSAGAALTTMYSVVIYNAPNSSSVLVEVTNKETGVVAQNTLTTDLPATTQGLNFFASRCMGGGGGLTNSGQFDVSILGVYSI